jgi:hypothetical protein
VVRGFKLGGEGWRGDGEFKVISYRYASRV